MTLIGQRFSLRAIDRPKLVSAILSHRAMMLIDCSCRFSFHFSLISLFCLHEYPFL